MTIAEQLIAASAQYFREFAHLANKDEEAHKNRSVAQKKSWKTNRETVFLSESIVQKLPKGPKDAIALDILTAMFPSGVTGISAALSKLIRQKRINRIGVRTKYRYFTD